MDYLAEDDVDAVIDELNDTFDNVFCNVQDCGKGVRKLVVGKMVNIRMMKKYEIFFR